MIYFIGGPPKCGKTTLAKKMSKKLGISWVSSDTLQVIGMGYTDKFLSKKEYYRFYPHNAMKGETNDETYSINTPKQIALNYQMQAKATYLAVDMFSICEISDGNDYIIEGYHITPELVTQLEQKYGKKNFKSIFLIKTDKRKFINDIKKSSTPNDWIIKRTKKEQTFDKITEMIVLYGGYFSKQAEKYGYFVLNMDEGFNKKLNSAINFLKKTT